VERIAILPFENLTDDPSLDWIANAAPAILVSEVAGSARITPLSLRTVSEAYRARATRFVHGYFTRRDKLRFQIEVEDAATHKMTSRTNGDGELLAAMNGVAKTLEPAARPFSTSNPEALAAWGRGENERAVSIDPDFGGAWLTWVQQLANAGNAPRAGEVAAQALARPQLRSPLERAQIEIVAATIHRDSEAQLKGMLALSQLEPADTTLLENVAAAEVAARRFADAIAHYQTLRRLDPANVVVTNSLGYAEAFAGNLDAARQALEDYGKQPDQKTNSLDSLGEVDFLHGRFAEAEKYFMEAHQTNPKFLSGRDLLKAAYARWLGGDLQGAQPIMQQYFEFRSNVHDPLLEWRKAVWEYETGSHETAIGMLQKMPENEAGLAEKQLAVWRGTVPPPSDLAALKTAYEHTVPQVDGEVRTFYAAALLVAGQKDEARKLLVLWPLPEAGGDSLFQAMIYPKFIELRRASETAGSNH
jgi:tetratricopeptide (TPR) repeat protein